MTALPRVFGSSLYSGFSSSRSSSFTLYSTGEDSFSGSESFDITIPATHNRGFVLRLTADETYSATGIVELDDVLWANGASPVYKVNIDDAGNLTLENTDDYIFTGSDGRFTIASLLPGLYAFDVPSEDGSWYLVGFMIPDDPDASSYIRVLDNLAPVEGVVLPAPYTSFSVYAEDALMTNEAFWKMLYPDMGEAV